MWAIALGVVLAAEPSGLIQPLSPGVSVDWTTGVLRIETEASRVGTEGQRAVEDLARREVATALEAGAGQLRLDRDRTLQQLLAMPDVETMLRARLGRWEVTEARYYASGRIGLTAELALPELLKPWALAHARREPDAVRPTERTGIVVDARGIPASPAFAPQLVTASGEVLFDGSTWASIAVETSPVVYVDDPAHPAAARAGPAPLFLRAVGQRGCDIEVSDADLPRWRDEVEGTRLIGEGRVVVVLDGG